MASAKCSDGAQVRRILALALVLEGRPRSEAASLIRLVGAVLLELNDEWQLQHRYMQTEAMAELTPALVEVFPPQIATAAE